MIMASRIVYGMANEGIVPAVLGRVHGGRRTPLIAILLTTGLAIVLVSTAEVFLRAGLLLLVGVACWALNRVVTGRTETATAPAA